MENNQNADTDYMVYPGVYVPSRDDQEVEAELKLLQGSKTCEPDIHIIETKDTFNVEIPIPGKKRGDFYLHAYGNIVSLSVMKKESLEPENWHSQADRYSYQCFDRQIILPKHAATEFVSAEYTDGVLHLVVPKIKRLYRGRYSRIVVY